jgi:hypothetical protein
MYFKLTIPQVDGVLIYRTEAVDVEDGIEQFEVAVLAGEIVKPAGLEKTGYGEIEIGWARESTNWE